MNHTAARKAFSPPYVALDYLARIRPERRPATRILDLPCGDGVVLAAAGLAGFDVTGCDLFPEYADRTLAMLRQGTPAVVREFWPQRAPALVREILSRPPPSPEPPTISVVKGDMSRPLPFPDARFDIALSLEGIEHIEGPESFLRETRRILKPGGTLLLSTPNPLCLRSRMAYAFAGQRTFRTFIDEYTTVQARDGDRLYHGHVFMLDYFQLRYLLHHAGFRIRSLLRPRYSPTSVALTPLLLPFIALATRLAQRKCRRAFRRLVTSGSIPPSTPSPYGGILRHILSPAALWGTIVIIEAEALAPSEPSAGQMSAGQATNAFVPKTA